MKIKYDGIDSQIRLLKATEVADEIFKVNLG